MKKCYKVQILNLNTLEMVTFEKYYGESGTAVRRNAIRRLQRNGVLGKGHKYEVKMWWLV